LIDAQLHDLGLADYHQTWQRQLDLLAARQKNDIPDTLLLVEHPHVITIGRSQKALQNVLSAGDVPVVEIERGGDVTYHGPGQLVAYPIVQLGDGEKDLHRFLRNLEEAIIRALADLGLPGMTRKPGATGVWTDDSARHEARKIASIGIACRKWVTFHGLALNVATDLAYFQRINPCGFDSSVMTSASVELGRPVTVADAKPRLAERLGESLGRRFSPA
jgi:lipoate-protein ligase B